VVHVEPHTGDGHGSAAEWTDRAYFVPTVADVPSTRRPAVVRSPTVRVEINGEHVSAEALWATASELGHFTAMQIRGGKARGLTLHLDRLEAANRELFGAGLDRDRVRQIMRHALGDTDEASLRVYVFESENDPAVMVTVRPPAEVSTPQRLRSVEYQRPLSHVKHLATGQGFYTRLARGDGFDDALLTGSGGVVSETATANICFADDAGVVWPDAPQLEGITMQLLQRVLPDLGMPCRRAPVRLEDVPRFAGAFVTNARGVAAVTRVDGTDLPFDAARLAVLREAYDSVPWDSL
jgi:branched-subunit amino acid aminotransferase/4-amino-4-deoxychorismate lyase